MTKTRVKTSSRKLASAAWVKSHLADRFNLPPEHVRSADLLEHWGLGDPSRLADLAAAFNASARSRADLNHAFVTPPELVVGLQGKKISDLISVLDNKVESLSVGRDDVTKWLLSYFNSNFPGQSIKLTTAFSAIPFPPGGTNGPVADLVALFNNHAKCEWQVDPQATAIEAIGTINGKKVVSLRDYFWDRVQDGLDRRFSR